VLTAEESPYPVYGADRYGEVIAWNRAATSYTDWARLPEGSTQHDPLVGEGA
jgi:hypothetical protein